MSKSVASVLLLLSALPQFNQIERCDNVGSMIQSLLRLDPRGESGSCVVPAKFARELIPDARLNLVRTQAVLEAPFGDFIIGAALPNALTHRRKLDTQKAAQVTVQPDAQTKIGMIICRQLAGLMQSDFIEHPCEMA